MIVIGIVLILAMAALATLVVVATGPSETLELWGVDVTTSLAGFFLLGVGATVILAAGVWLLAAGIAHSRRRRHEIRELRQQAEARAEPTVAPAASPATEPWAATEPTSAERTFGERAAEPEPTPESRRSFGESDVDTTTGGRHGARQL